MKILVAMPVYDGKVPVETVKSLLDERAAALVFGDDFHLQFLPGCSHPGQGRNQLAQAFMDSDCERLVFLDSDVTWEPGHLLKLAHYPVDFVGGCYRHKKPEESYPVHWMPDPELKGLRSNELGLIEVAGLPGGFMSLSRNVFDKLKAAHPSRHFEFMGHKMHGFFEMPFNTGEDGYFCKSWIDLGEKIFLDPRIRLTHWSFAPTPYTGSIGDWLGGMKPEPLAAHCMMTDEELKEAGI